MRTGRNNRDKGYSLIELVVVIAIMAILVGVFTISISSLSGRKVNKCADEIVATLERARVLTLGKEQNQVEFRLFYDETEKQYRAQIYQGGVAVTDRVIGKDPIEIKVTFENDVTMEYKLADGIIKGSAPYVVSGVGEEGLFLVFNRSSGAFEQGTNTVGNSSSDVRSYCSKIIVSSGSRTIEITPVGRTGKILKKAV